MYLAQRTQPRQSRADDAGPVSTHLEDSPRPAAAQIRRRRPRRRGWVKARASRTRLTGGVTRIHESTTGMYERMLQTWLTELEPCHPSPFRRHLGLVGCPSRPSSAPCRATAEKLLADCVSAHPRQPPAAPGARPPCGAIIEHTLVRHGIRGRGGASRLCPERWRRADALPWPNGAPGWRDGRSVALSTKKSFAVTLPYDPEPSHI
eukprot:COSAG01_NODE_512_length_16051_cov_33.887161_21_plen_206_part_00